MSATLPWAVKQLSKVRETRPELVDRAVTSLLEANAELRWSVVLSAYLDQLINLGKAAELLDLHELELRERFRSLGVPLRVGASDLSEAQAEVDALDSWFAEQPSRA